MTKKNEIRTIAAGLRAAADNAWTIEGVAASYNHLSQNLGGFYEVLQPGCFARHLAQKPDVICCFQHDPSKILGRTASKTLEIIDTPTALTFRCQLDPNQQSAKDLWYSIKRGDCSEMSFAFNVDGDDGEKCDRATDRFGQPFIRRTIKRALLRDVAPVISPAYANGATHVSARSRVADYEAGGDAIPTGVLSDSALRAECERRGEEIRIAELLDPSCRAVKPIYCADGSFKCWQRDFAEEAEIANREKFNRDIRKWALED